MALTITSYQRWPITMKLATFVLAFLAATVQAKNKKYEGLGVIGAMLNTCYNTEVIDIGSAGSRKWTLFTYCPKDRDHPEAKLQTLDLDKCIANDHGSLTWREK